MEHSYQSSEVGHDIELLPLWCDVRRWLLLRTAVPALNYELLWKFFIAKPIGHVICNDYKYSAMEQLHVDKQADYHTSNGCSDNVTRVSKHG